MRLSRKFDGFLVFCSIDIGFEIGFLGVLWYFSNICNKKVELEPETEILISYNDSNYTINPVDYNA
jgi:translation elongation factor EF-4